MTTSDGPETSDEPYFVDSSGEGPPAKKHKAATGALLVGSLLAENHQPEPIDSSPYKFPHTRDARSLPTPNPGHSKLQQATMYQRPSHHLTAMFSLESPASFAQMSR